MLVFSSHASWGKAGLPGGSCPERASSFKIVVSAVAVKGQACLCLRTFSREMRDGGTVTQAPSATRRMTRWTRVAVGLTSVGVHEILRVGPHVTESAWESFVFGLTSLGVRGVFRVWSHASGSAWSLSCLVSRLWECVKSFVFGLTSLRVRGVFRVWSRVSGSVWSLSCLVSRLWECVESFVFGLASLGVCGVLHVGLRVSESVVTLRVVHAFQV